MISRGPFYNSVTSQNAGSQPTAKSENFPRSLLALPEPQREVQSTGGPDPQEITSSVNLGDHFNYGSLIQINF